VVSGQGQGQWSGSVIRVRVRVKVRRLVGDLAEQVGHTLGRVVVARDRQHHLDVVEQRGQAVDHRCGRAVVPMRPREHGVARRAHAALPPLPMAKGAALLASLSPRGPSKLVRPRLSRLRPRGPAPRPCAAALCRCPAPRPCAAALGCPLCCPGSAAPHGAHSAVTCAACRASMCFSSVARYLQVGVPCMHVPCMCGACAVHVHGVLRLPRLT
jgi:hypothetical protein